MLEGSNKVNTANHVKGTQKLWKSQESGVENNRNPYVAKRKQLRRLPCPQKPVAAFILH